MVSYEWSVTRMCRTALPGKAPGSGTSCLFLEELSAAARECRGSVPSGGFLPSPAVLHDSPRGVSSRNTNCVDRSEWKESLNWKNSWSLPGIFCSHLLPFSPFLLWPLGLLFLTSLCCFPPRARTEVALFAPWSPEKWILFCLGISSAFWLQSCVEESSFLSAP